MVYICLGQCEDVKNNSIKTKTNKNDDKCLYCDVWYSTSVDECIQSL